MSQKSHWEKVYKTKKADEVSWFQKHSEISLRLIEQSGVGLSDAVIDIGGGASTLVDDLIDRGYTDLTVLDISEKALDVARRRLANRARQVNWVVGDITVIRLPEKTYMLWHDRAVFHFLINPEDRQQYIESIARSVKSGGHVIIATFAEDGPEKCSGLPVKRYSVTELQHELGKRFKLMHHEREQHSTPSGVVQNFNYCQFVYCPSEG